LNTIPPGEDGTTDGVPADGKELEDPAGVGAIFKKIVAEPAGGEAGNSATLEGRALGEGAKPPNAGTLVAENEGEDETAVPDE